MRIVLVRESGTWHEAEDQCEIPDGVLGQERVMAHATPMLCREMLTAGQLSELVRDHTPFECVGKTTAPLPDGADEDDAADGLTSDPQPRAPARDIPLDCVVVGRLTASKYKNKVVAASWWVEGRPD
jgi:hypothetical protein